MYGYGYGYGYYGFDWTYLLLIIGMLLSLAASAKLKSTFARYKSKKRIGTYRGRSSQKDSLQCRDHRCTGKTGSRKPDGSL